MTDRYPLFCVAHPDVYDFYVGPFESEAEAAGIADEDDLVVRCRRLRAQDLRLPALVWAGMADIHEVVAYLDELVLSREGVDDAVWFDADKPVAVLVLDDGSLPSNLTFRAWINRHVRIDAYVCEEDDQRGAPRNRSGQEPIEEAP
jgi:hypothetical protein